ncbi:hypothetical protein AOL_s00076g203 [Orbilia oligospora ATCC 24927]|uniref:THO complex subunit 5 n=2 Tax=Orbilia oligospora TaxID=2813651 RepID=G1X996_ARTOA|nr:hypothetical protein AOL_s00076g203 [Orbilia oligospora ATCC 24927]EGX50439.1 hypothetical protein AOL_s00076g203 [Orbilia oligospora ATCC 24927]KAF3277716.1 hypothetical protein TWF970_004969 [Orbilia oligospora]
MAPEIASRITEQDLQECLQALQNTREICLQIVSQDRARATTTNSSQKPPSPEDRLKSQKQLFAAISRLRSLHRTAYMTVRQTKQTTSEARQEQDRLHLQLQNLYYQQRHLRGEIDACLDFQHTYEDIPLVDQADYLARHPEHEDMDPHELMKLRLADERAVREELETQRKQLITKKQALIAENKKRKEDLASLDEHLKKFIESSKPIQETFKKEY